MTNKTVTEVMDEALTTEEVGRESRLALSKVRAYLTSDGQDKSLYQQARVASNLLGTWSRLQQTERARDANIIMMARDLAANKDELREYLRVAMPSSPLVKALPVPRK